MFDIGWSELLVIAVVTIIVVGPKDLPRLLRSVGQIARKVRATANEFRGHVDDVIRDAELDDLKSTMDDVKSMNPINQVKNAISDEIEGVRDIVSETDIRNYHEDFPDDEPYDDFDDPGAEWDDDDDETFDDPKPEPTIDAGDAGDAGKEVNPNKSSKVADKSLAASVDTPDRKKTSTTSVAKSGAKSGTKSDKKTGAKKAKSPPKPKSPVKAAPKSPNKPKSSNKSPTKSPAKPSAKSPSKSSAKPSAKSSAKPAAKPPVKPAAARGSA